MTNGFQVCEIDLSLGLIKKVLLETLNKTLEDGKHLSIGKSTFYKIWRSHFMNVKTPSKQRMSKYKIYDKFKGAIEQTKCEVL